MTDAATRRAERARYEDLKEHGICPACAAEDAAPGRVLGPTCAAKRRARYRAFRAAKMALPDPPCRDCLTNPRRPGKKSCQPCADRYAQYQRERALWRKVA